MGPNGWGLSIVPWAQQLRMPKDFDMTAYFYFGVPSMPPMPPIDQEGDYYFASVLIYPNTTTWACNASLAPFAYGSQPTILLSENFDSYEEGTYLGHLPGWWPLCNAVTSAGEWYVTGEQSYSPPHAARLWGTHGGCWEGGLGHGIPYYDRVTVSAAIRVAGEASGCHNRETGFGIGGDDSWIVLVVSCTPLDASAGGLYGWTNQGNGARESLELVSGYENIAHNWYHVTFEADFSSGIVTFAVDGEYKGQLPLSHTEHYVSFDMNSGDGLGRVDDVLVTTP